MPAVLRQYYDTDFGAYVWKDVAQGSPNGEFWYQVWMAMLPLQILHARTPYVAPWPAPARPLHDPPPSRLAPYVLNATLNWAAAETALGGSAASLPDFVRA